jgi:hypothetical protein
MLLPLHHFCVSTVSNRNEIYRVSEQSNVRSDCAAGLCSTAPMRIAALDFFIATFLLGKHKEK